MDTLYPFALTFDGSCARFPFIFEGTPIGSTGGNSGNPAPVCIVSGRSAGDMVFRGIHGPAREAFFYPLGIPPERVYSLMQVHSHDVFVLGGAPQGRSAASALPPEPASLPAPAAFAREGDGMVSFFPGVVLAVTVADCLPVFLLDTENGYWAVLHSGWKGTGIVLKALEIMRQAGTRPEALAAVLGPCIQSCCYRVDEERAKYFEAEFGSAPHERSFGSAPPYEHSSGSTPPRDQSSGSTPPRDQSSAFPLGPVSRRDDSGWYIGLQAANARLLTAAGVRHIAYCTDCTFTDERLGSFRREGPQSYTRMIAMAGHIP